MPKTLIPSLLLAGASAVTTPAALAQQGCTTRDDMTLTLSDRYGEQIRGAGLRSESAMVELWQSPETGSWSILLTRPDGTSCILAHGTDWTSLPPTPTGTKS